MRYLYVLCCVAAFGLNAAAQTGSPLAGEAISGSITRYPAFPSRNVAARNIDVWVPAGYSPSRKYSVIYMHDGQNLFDPKTSYGGAEWGIDETMTRLHAEARIRPTIVVGIWNTPLRLEEYMPQKAFEMMNAEQAAALQRFRTSGKAISDDYLRFIVEELKPFIDRTYSTHRKRDNTFIMGSSMGGLISLYAVMEYPKVFGGAACVSTHFPIGDGVVIEYMKKALPAPGDNRFYFDYGTKTLDATYEPFQMKADEVMRSRGYTGKNWMTRKFEGEEHSERSWRKRADIPLVFLLGK